MFKKTKVRSIQELLGKGLSARKILKSLSVSRNTVSEVQTLYHESGKSWEDIADWDDDRLYELFYPDQNDEYGFTFIFKKTNSDKINDKISDKINDKINVTDTVKLTDVDNQIIKALKKNAYSTIAEIADSISA